MIQLFKWSRHLYQVSNNYWTPDLSESRTLSIFLQMPSLCHISLARLHVNKRCFISSQPSWHAGQLPEFSICLFARIPLHSNAPCSVRHPKIFILLGIFFFDNCLGFEVAAAYPIPLHRLHHHLDPESNFYWTCASIAGGMRIWQKIDRSY